MSREYRPEREQGGCFTQLKRLFSGKEKQRNIWEEDAEQRRRQAARQIPAPRTQRPPLQDVRGNFGEEQHRLQKPKPAVSRTLEHKAPRKPVHLGALAVGATRAPTRAVSSRPLPSLPTAQADQDRREAYAKTVSSRSLLKVARQHPPARSAQAYQHRPLPALPTDQGHRHREADLPRPLPRPSAPMNHGTPKRETPETRQSRGLVLDMELPPPEHGYASSLFPEPLAPKKSAPGPSARRSMGLDSVIRKPSTPTRAEPLDTNGVVGREHNSFGRKASAGQPERLNLETIPVVPGRSPKEGHFSREHPMSLNINNVVVGDQGTLGEGLARLPLTPRDTNNLLSDNKEHRRPVHWKERDLSAPLPPLPLEPSKVLSPPPPYTPQKQPRLPRRSASATLRYNTPMEPTAVRAVVTWLRENLAHVPYAVTSLSALAMWGFDNNLPSHVSILCPEHCRDVITSWAVATGVVLDPRQRRFGLRLDGEDTVRRVRLRFVPAEEFSRLRTVGRGRVLGLASLVDVLAAEFMDMKGEKVGEKRVVLGGGIAWAVERMVATRAPVGGGEARNVRNLLFLEPFVCTFPGSRELLVKAGLIWEGRGSQRTLPVGGEEGGRWKRRPVMGGAVPLRDA